MKLSYIFTLIFCTISIGLTSQTSILDARTINADGTLAMEGQTVTLTGIAIGPNFRPGGLTFILHDSMDMVGITVFSSSDDLGYEVSDGDELEVVGELSQFNGLAEIVPTTINILSTDNPLPDPVEVSMLDETTESNLIVFRDAMLVDEDDWDNAGSFNLAIHNGSDTIEMRIDSDTDISGMQAPTGTFDVTGVGGQFDSDAPFLQGYQIFPRSAADISPYNTTGTQYEVLTMREARETDGNGALVRDGDRVELTGVVHGINLRPNGLQFWFIDNANTGIAVFSSSEQFGYTVNAGDELTIRGVLSEFNGLAQINPEEIALNSTGNDTNDPDEVDALNEDTESAWITINAIEYVNESDWLGDGTSFNVDVVNVTGDTLRIRIDDGTPWASMPAPEIPAMVTGVGSQFDSSSPYDSGYQILPLFDDAFDNDLSIDNLYTGAIKIFPNPAESVITIEAEDLIDRIEIFDLTGRLVLNSNYPGSLGIADLQTGQYVLRVTLGEEVWIQSIFIR